MQGLITLSNIEALFWAGKHCFDWYRQHWADVHYLRYDGVLWKNVLIEIINV